MRGLVADVIVGIIAIEAIRIYGKIKYEQGKMDAAKAIVVEVKKEDYWSSNESNNRSKNKDGNRCYILYIECT